MEFVSVLLIVIVLVIVLYVIFRPKSDLPSPRSSIEVSYSTSDSYTLTPEMKKQNKERWKIDFYGGDEFDYTGKKIERSDGKGGVWTGYKDYFRKYVCESKEIISDRDLITIHKKYYSEFDPITEKETRLKEVNHRKRLIHKEFCEPLKNQKYNKEEKSWVDFDVTGVFMRVRGLMIDDSKPFPQYVWNVVSGNPFNRIYRVCRDYTKWKGTLQSSKVLFENVCKWENGDIYREGEPHKELESPLWMNWNTIGKDFLTLKTKLKKDSPEGLDWLKNTVGGYISERKEFYNQFGENSDHFIQDELLEKYGSIKVG